MTNSPSSNTPRHKSVLVIYKRRYLLLFLVGLIAGVMIFALSVNVMLGMRQGELPSLFKTIWYMFLELGCLWLILRGGQGMRAKRLSQELYRQMQNRGRVALTELCEARHQKLDKLARDLHLLMRYGALPREYLDYERKELVLDPDSPKPPLSAAAEKTVLVTQMRKAAAPVYVILLVWFLYSFVSPLFRLVDLALGLLLAAGAYWGAAKLMPGYPTLVEQPKPEEKAEPISTGDSDLDAFLSRSIEAMSQLSALHMGIVKESMRDSLQTLMKVAKEIFDYVKEHPRKVHSLRQFTKYYLPMSIKLLQNYQEMEQQPEKGQNIRASMQKIEEAMADMVAAFRRELDSLYHDQALDISADIEVMKNMMDLNGLGGLEDSPFQPSMGKKEAEDQATNDRKE